MSSVLEKAEFSGNRRFRIVRRLGAGGMGVVYEAEDAERHERVALKTLKHRDADTIYQLKREFRALADLSHPHLVSLYDLFIDEDSCFFTMELIRGKELLHWCASAATRTGPEHSHDDTMQPVTRALASDESRLRPALKQLAEGLNALHGFGMIHRDVKPTNVMVTDEGNVKILDFGLVALDRLTTMSDRRSVEGGVVGTAAYMAPEQAAGGELTPASDWYSVGVLLYEALTGVVPFTGPILQVLMDKQQRTALAPRELIANVPGDLDALCEALLERDPARRPRGQHVLQRLGVSRTLEAQSSPVPLTRPHFAGREAELAHLEEALGTVEQGRARAVLVRGPSGIGKSSLVFEFMQRLREESKTMVVLEGRCSEREQMPFKAFDGLIDDLTRYWRSLSEGEAMALLPREATLLARLFPALGRVPVIANAPYGRDIPDPLELRNRAFAALRETLLRLADRHPTVLVLDDMQWVDADTVALLSDVMRTPDPPAVLLILLSRETENVRVDQLMGHLESARSTIEVGPLAEADAVRLTTELAGDIDRESAARLSREAGGSPFFLVEMARYLQTLDGAAVQSISLDDMLGARLATLTDDGRRLLQVISLAGEPITKAAAAAAAGMDAALAVRETGHLRTQRLVRGEGGRDEDRLEAYHDRIRETVLATVATEDRRRLHQALAVAMDHEASCATLARHWRAAGDSERAAAFALRAAEEAEKMLAFDRAAVWYRQAMKLRRGDKMGRNDLHVKLGETLVNAGRGAEAAEQFLAAAARAPSSEGLVLQRRAAEHMIRVGQIDAGIGVLRTVVERVGLRLPRTSFAALAGHLALRARLRFRGIGYQRRQAGDIDPSMLNRLEICYGASSSFAMCDPIQGAYFQSKYFLLALEAGEPHHMGRALAIEGGYVGVVGNDRQRAMLVIERARVLAEEYDDAYLLALAAACQGHMEFQMGNFRPGVEASDYAAKVLAEVCTGVEWERMTVALYALWSIWYLGEMGELSRRVLYLIHQASKRGDRFAMASLGTGLQSSAFLVLNEPDTARRVAAEAMESWTPNGYHVQHYWHCLALVHADLYEGKGREALARVRAEWPKLEKAFLLRIRMLRIEALFMRARVVVAAAALCEADAPALLKEADRLARQLERIAMPAAKGLGGVIRACVAFQRGGADAAIPALLEGEELCAASDLRLLQATCRWYRGRLLGGEAGATLASEGSGQIAGQGLLDAERFCGLLVPGFRFP